MNQEMPAPHGVRLKVSQSETGIKARDMKELTAILWKTALVIIIIRFAQSTRPTAV
jgi:hypothetical protein